MGSVIRKGFLFVIVLLLGAYGAGFFYKNEVVVSTQIAAPPQKVWDTLIAFETYPEWNPFIIEASGDLIRGSTLQIKTQLAGSSEVNTFTPKLMSATPPRKLRWQGMFLVPGLFDGDHSFDIVGTDLGTTLIQKESFRGILQFVVSLESVRQSFVDMNNALKKRVEHGIQ